jgi:hypothetical protein
MQKKDVDFIVVLDKINKEFTYMRALKMKTEIWETEKIIMKWKI